MYAVIRSGGKQYRVAPGDVIRVESLVGAQGSVHFEVLAASNGEKFATGSSGAKVTGEVMDHGRGDKILVFKFKRKKQYKKLIGHRQSFSAIRILEIGFAGKKASAPAVEVKEKKLTKQKEAAHAPAKKAAAKKSATKSTTGTKKSAAKKSAAKKPAKKK